VLCSCPSFKECSNRHNLQLLFVVGFTHTVACSVIHRARLRSCHTLHLILSHPAYRSYICGHRDPISAPWKPHAYLVTQSLSHTHVTGSSHTCRSHICSHTVPIPHVTPATPCICRSLMCGPPLPPVASTPLSLGGPMMVGGWWRPIDRGDRSSRAVSLKNLTKVQRLCLDFDYQMEAQGHRSQVSAPDIPHTYLK
jgi:hypothetical protein